MDATNESCYNGNLEDTEAKPGNKFEDVHFGHKDAASQTSEKSLKYAASQTADKSLEYIYQLQKCNQNFRQKEKPLAEDIDSKRNKLAHPEEINTEGKYEKLLDDLESAGPHFTSDEIDTLRQWSLWKPKGAKKIKKPNMKQQGECAKRLPIEQLILTSTHSVQPEERDGGTLVTSRTEEYKYRTASQLLKNKDADTQTPRQSIKNKYASTQTPRQFLKSLYELVEKHQCFRPENSKLYKKIMDLRHDAMHPLIKDINTREKYQELLEDLESAGFFTSEEIDKLRGYDLWQPKKKKKKSKSNNKKVTPSGTIEDATASNPSEEGRK